MQVTTVRQLVHVLGGPRAAAAALFTSPQQVVHWRNANRIPPGLFLRHQKTLQRLGIRAPANFWRCGYCGHVARLDEPLRTARRRLAAAAE